MVIEWSRVIGRLNHNQCIQLRKLKANFILKLEKEIFMLISFGLMISLPLFWRKLRGVIKLQNFHI